MHLLGPRKSMWILLRDTLGILIKFPTLLPSRPTSLQRTWHAPEQRFSPGGWTLGFPEGGLQPWVGMGCGACLRSHMRQVVAWAAPRAWLEGSPALTGQGEVSGVHLVYFVGTVQTCLHRHHKPKPSLDTHWNSGIKILQLYLEVACVCNASRHWNYALTSPFYISPLPGPMSYKCALASDISELPTTPSKPGHTTHPAPHAAWRHCWSTVCPSCGQKHQRTHFSPCT